MNKLVDKRVAFVTGAASGIGLEIAKALLEEGASVVISDIDPNHVQKSVQLLENKGHRPGRVAGIVCDVTNEEQIRNGIQYTIDTFGRLEILVNNAGLQYVSPIEEFPVEKFELLVKVMLIAPFIAMKNVFPIMKKQQYGRILNVASINGLIGFAGKSAYNSAKHGVIGLTKVAALEAAEYGINVNALCPGYVDTPLVRGQIQDLAKTRNVSVDKVFEEVIYPLVPQRRLLSTKEIADYAVLLSSDVLKGVTGTAAVIDGGYTAQ